MRLREIVSRSAWAVTMGAMMGGLGLAFGSVLGFARGPSGAEPEEDTRTEEEVDEARRKNERNFLLRRVKQNGMIRRALEQIGPVAIPLLADAEYNDRRRLEELGFYPCPKCGIPHLDGGKRDDCLPAGAYWHDELRRYVEPDHPDWTPEGYEAATGHPWRDPEDEQGGTGGIH